MSLNIRLIELNSYAFLMNCAYHPNLNLFKKFLFKQIIMYKNSDPLVSIATAAVGAGSAAYIGVSQGQSVLAGLGITIIATLIALVVDRLLCFES
jgi:hypothetical protein